MSEDIKDQKTVYYATLGTTHGGPGYIKIFAENENEARKLVNEYTGHKWAFMYDSLEDVHKFDRILIDTIIQ